MQMKNATCIDHNHWTLKSSLPGERQGVKRATKHRGEGVQTRSSIDQDIMKFGAKNIEAGPC